MKGRQSFGPQMPTDCRHRSSCHELKTDEQKRAAKRASRLHEQVISSSAIEVACQDSAGVIQDHGVVAGAEVGEHVVGLRAEERKLSVAAAGVDVDAAGDEARGVERD